MRTLQSIIALAVLFAGCGVHAAIVAQDMHVVNANINPDGFSRSAVTANGVFPGPLISGNIGDNFKINVIDELTDATMYRSTSIHWHGFFQHGTAHMDGPSFVNQCPIVPGHSFEYDFQTPGQAGTYWYHSHLSTQYCDGLRGPFVVYDPQDPQASLYDVDDASTVITLADYYHQTSNSLFPNPNKAAPTPDATTINGLGRYSGGPASPLAVVRAQPNLKHRFRIVSTSCFPSYLFSIDGHSMTVIEADGVAHQPVVVDSLRIHAGQRYSVIVEANQPVGNYWIRAAPSFGTAAFTGGLNMAILRYDGAPVADPTSTQATGTLLNEGNLIPLVNPGAPGNPVHGGADVNLNLVIGRDTASRNFTFNAVAFVPPTVPVLLQILSGAVSPGSIMPSGSVINLPPNQVIEVSIPGGGNHPIHLHGHNFDVVRVSGSSTYNYANPVRRDVVSIGGAGDNVTFRFTTDNGGPWLLHCHMEWHLDAGLAIVFAEDAPNIASTNPVNTAWSDLCPLFESNNPDSAWGI